MNALQAGLLTFVSAAGALVMKTAAPPILRRFGFRRVLVVNTFIVGVSIPFSTEKGGTTAVWRMRSMLDSLRFTRSTAAPTHRSCIQPPAPRITVVHRGGNNDGRTDA
jgi:hypothetical protein